MDAGTLRFVGLVGPWMLVLALARILGPFPDRARRIGAMFLSGLWVFASLPIVNRLAVEFSLWQFETVGGHLLRMPLDLTIGWAILWGVLPHFSTRVSLGVWLLLFLVLDVVLMPLCGSVVTLREHWLIGEFVMLALCAWPALWLGRWVILEERLPCRAALQLLTFAVVFFVWMPAVIAQFSSARLEVPNSLRALALAAMVIVLVPGWRAVQEFVEHGEGTPFPLDPTSRLVTSGPYRYVQNPMQLSMVLAFPLWAVVLELPLLALASPIGLIFSAGFAKLSEREQMNARFGEPWRQYSRELRNWWPRWRPGPREETPTRGDSFEDSITGLEHENLARAWISFALRLPLIRPVAARVWRRTRRSREHATCASSLAKR